jgi:serine/threonine-protein kinase PknK
VATIPPTPGTKYRPPTSPSGLVDRRRLLDRLEAGRNRRLCLIHAPAGFGKTTLAAQWTDQLVMEGCSVAWISIDRDDNNPVWLLAHLIEAIRAVRPDWSEPLRAALEQHVDDAARYVLPTLIDQVDASGEPLFLMIDDWHRVSDPRAIACLEFLLDLGSPRLPVLITSRSRAGLPLGRLRVRDQLVEIDDSMLRFNPAESEQLLIKINGLPLGQSEVADLVGTTDGWVAALQLASLSLRGEQDLPQQIKNLAGRHHSLEVYLAENVLDRLTPSMLDFLLRTCLPEQLCADLVDALTGDRNGRAMLEEVEAADLFLYPLDTDRTWFRYHHLFVEFLRHRLERDHPDDVPELHRRAATWFAAHDLLSEAVDHALAAGDPGYAVDIITGRAMDLFEQSGTTTLLALVDKLPTGLATEQPRLQLALGWANTLLQRPEEAVRALEELELSLRRGTAREPDAGAASLLLESRLLRASFTGHADRFDGLDEVAGECLAQADALPPGSVTLAACLQTWSLLHRFDFAASRRRMLWARPYFERSAGLQIPGLGMCLAAIAALEELDVEGARRHLNLALQWGERNGGRRSYMPQMAVAHLGALAYHLGEIETAAEYLAESQEFGENGLTDYILPNRVVLPRLTAYQGDRVAAEELLAQSAIGARELGLDRLAATVIEEQARLGFPAFTLEPAVPALIGGPQDGISFAIADSLDTARIYRGLHQGRTAAGEVLPVAEALLARVESQHRPLTTLRSRVLLAATLHRAGHPLEARACLLPALRSCARTGLISPVSDGGAPVAEILSRLVTDGATSTQEQIVDGVPDHFLIRLHDHTAAWSDKVPAVAAVDLTADPDTRFTEREMEILELLDVGRSNQQIARQLSLSTNTVKWYLKTLYQKFGVTRRQECVAVARGAGLLPISQIDRHR